MSSTIFTHVYEVRPRLTVCMNTSSKDSIDFNSSLSAKVMSSGALLRVSDESASGAVGSDQTSLISVVFSVLGVEAFINELDWTWPWPADKDPGLEKKFKQLSKELDLPADLRDAFVLLIHTRNALVHLRPEVVDLDDSESAFSPNQIVRRLESLKVVTLEPGTNHTLVATLRRTEVGKWANELARRVIRESVLRLPEGPLKDRECSRWSKIPSPNAVI
jgi:hypothetical protein